MRTCDRNRSASGRPKSSPTTTRSTVMFSRFAGINCFRNLSEFSPCRFFIWKDLYVEHLRSSGIMAADPSSVFEGQIKCLPCRKDDRDDRAGFVVFSLSSYRCDSIMTIRRKKCWWKYV
ncbi:uncharacterized protein LOC124681387 [Lolium rigidum]|uniref:uncharacterized protein LOC124681387 n=1 Tax=Lolium rigidum TaxID=89674 RepID=UPI001F5CA173|nr:uncharacterized protein LOC124681387 [Lolium rigidum]